MRRHLSLTILLFLALTAQLRAENAVRFSDAVVEPGDRVSVDVTLECESELLGWNLVLRWSSADLHCDSFRIIRESFDSRYLFVEQPIDQASRLIRLAIVPKPFGDPPFPTVPAGSHYACRLHFTAESAAPDQFVYVDSGIVMIVDEYYHDTAIEASAFAAPGSVALYPTFYPGRVTIGDPGTASMIVSPSSITIHGETGDLSPVTRTLEIRSNSGLELDWSATWVASWIEVSPPNGHTPAFPVIYADPFLLEPGEYRHSITITSPIAENSPLTIPVYFIVDTQTVDPPEGFNFSLGQSKPSPFVAYSDPETRIPFLLEEPSHVVIELFDILGRRIKTLTSGNYGAGEAEVIWDGRDARGEAAASGHYICRMSTESGETSRVIVLIR